MFGFDPHPDPKWWSGTIANTTNHKSDDGHWSVWLRFKTIAVMRWMLMWYAFWDRRDVDIERAIN
jgi:hypothetical protein